MVQDTAYEVVPNQQQQQVTLTVDAATAFNMKLMEFDKLIAESEAKTADLKRQKAAYIYDSNLNILMERAKTQQNPETPQPTGN